MDDVYLDSIHLINALGDRLCDFVFLDDGLSPSSLMRRRSSPVPALQRVRWKFDATADPIVLQSDQPVDGFVSFLGDEVEFGRELVVRASASSRTIVR